MRFAALRPLAVALALWTLSQFGSAPVAAADLGRHDWFHPLREDSLFTLSPAAFDRPRYKVGLALGRSYSASTLDQSNEGDRIIKTKEQVDNATIAGEVDLGAGALVGLTYLNQLGEWNTSRSDAPDAPPKLEQFRRSLAHLRLAVELTETVKAGILLRYSRTAYSILGDLFLGDDDRTYYHATMTGYGGGLAMNYRNIRLNYNYFPPLRGKAPVLGEELLVVEDGKIAVEANWEYSDQLSLGAFGYRQLGERGDRRAGTTASASDRQISLYGLNLEQFVRIDRDYGIKGSAALNSIWRGSVGLVYSRALLNFRDTERYNGIAVRQNERAGDAASNFIRLLGGLSFKHTIATASITCSFWQRQRNLPEAWRGATYRSSGSNISLTVVSEL